MDKIQILALLGIVFLLLAGILNSIEGGDWKYLVLSIIYGIANTLIFILK